MRIIIVIPSRYNAHRFPGKALYDLRGKALVHHVYDNISSCIGIDDCIVATDDDRILDYCSLHKIKVVMTSSHHVNGTERIAELAANYENDDIIINVQGDEPLVNEEQIRLLIKLMQDRNSPPIASLGRVIRDMGEILDPNIVKFVMNLNGDALYFSRAPIPHNRDSQLVELNYYQHIGMYAFRVKVLKELVKLPMSALEKIEKLEQLRWLENGYSIRMGITDKPLIGIDTPSDVNRLYDFWDSIGS